MRDYDLLFKKLVEAFKPVNCKTVKRDEKDKVIKGKKDKPDTKEREISITKKCDLVSVDAVGKPKPTINNKEPSDGGGGRGKISVDKDKFDYMVNRKDGKTEEPTDRMVDYDALLRMLKEDDAVLEDIVIRVIKQINLQQEDKKNKMSNWEKKKRKKELNKKYNDERKKMERDLPLKAIHKDMMSLANGIAESGKKKDS